MVSTSPCQLPLQNLGARAPKKIFVCFFILMRPFSCLGSWFSDSIESIEFRFPVSDSIEGLS